MVNIIQERFFFARQKSTSFFMICFSSMKNQQDENIFSFSTKQDIFEYFYKFLHTKILKGGGNKFIFKSMYALCMI